MPYLLPTGTRVPGAAPRIVIYIAMHLYTRGVAATAVPVLQYEVQCCVPAGPHGRQSTRHSASAVVVDFERLRRCTRVLLVYVPVLEYSFVFNTGVDNIVVWHAMLPFVRTCVRTRVLPPVRPTPVMVLTLLVAAHSIATGIDQYHNTRRSTDCCCFTTYEYTCTYQVLQISIAIPALGVCQSWNQATNTKPATTSKQR